MKGRSVRAMIINPKFQVGDRVSVKSFFRVGEVIKVEMVYHLKDGIENLGSYSEHQLELVSRPCKHTKGYYPQSGAASSDWVAFAHCPNCGEKL